jgi:L-cystine uptake protein TcyP (sodium:dicarboxylate symporter family)
VTQLNLKKKLFLFKIIILIILIYLLKHIHDKNIFYSQLFFFKIKMKSLILLFALLAFVCSNVNLRGHSEDYLGCIVLEG